MKKNLLIMSFIMLSSILCAQKPVEIKLWPNGAPNENGIKEQKINCYEKEFTDYEFHYAVIYIMRTEAC